MSFGRVADQIPLCVDLDGTLIRSNLLLEGLASMIARRSAALLRLPAVMARGRPALKRFVHENSDVDHGRLAVRAEVVEAIAAARRAGRPVFLVTASDVRAASAFAGHHEFIDGVIASDDGVNMKGERKASVLCERFGARGFDYIGDSAADLPVWRQARQAYVVGSRALSLAGRAGDGQPAPITSIEPRPSRFQSWLRAMRPHQWTKNLLILVPLVTSGLLGSPPAVGAALTAFVLFSLAASGTYLLNDIIDAQADRRHESKRRRPFAAGDLSLGHGMVAAAAMVLCAVVAGFLVQPLLGILVVAYVAGSVAYTARLKAAVLIDVMTLAGLYTLRIVVGALVVQVELSFWLLAFAIFFFASLALAKRYAELLLYPGLEADPHRRRGYRAGDASPVLSLGTASGVGAVIILALYIEERAAAIPYGLPWLLWLTVPVVLYWVSRVWIVAARGEMNDDPIVWAIRDRLSLLSGGLAALLYLVARYA